MSFFYRTGNMNADAVFDIGSYAIIGGLSALTIGTALNDLYCSNVLNFKNERTTHDINTFNLYHAKYTKIFIALTTLSGVYIGARFGYTKKPLFMCN